MVWIRNNLDHNTHQDVSKLKEGNKSTFSICFEFLKMKSCMILIYFIMMVIMGYASEKDENTKKGEWEVKEKTVNPFFVFSC